MARDSAYVAVYDVSDDRERSRLAAVLEGFGLRVQFSAFELRLSPATRQTLLRRLEDLKLTTGFLYLYRRAGNHDRTAVGAAPVDTLAETNHAWVVAEPAAQPRPCRSVAAPRERSSAPATGRRTAPRPQSPPIVNPVLPAAYFAVSDAAGHAAPGPEGAA